MLPIFKPELRSVTSLKMTRGKRHCKGNRKERLGCMCGSKILDKFFYIGRWIGAFFFVYCLKELKAIYSIGSPSEASAAITFAPYRERETFLVLCHPSKMARPLKLLSIYG